MKVTKLWNGNIVLSDVSNDDLKQLYIRTSLTNSAVNEATMIDYRGERVSGFDGKKVPDTAFGCEFSCLFDGIWD